MRQICGHCNGAGVLPDTSCRCGECLGYVQYVDPKTGERVIKNADHPR